jgi:beta-barrel assembly-enhancing protease
MKRRLAREALAIAALCALAAPAAAGPAIADAAAGYQPQDTDERGLWMQMEEQERELKTSRFIMRDPALNAYVRSVFCRTVGQVECKDIRIYLMRTPYFNASMAPNGMMQVWSGLLLRTRDEAQLAAILGHEYTHYQKRHSLKLFHDAKKKLATGNWLGMIIPLVQLAMVASIFENSREMEAEADSGSIAMMAKAGYDPMAASRIWEQLRAEMDATAVARNKKSRKDKNGGMFASHPPTLDRMNDLKVQAQKLVPAGTPSTNQEAFRAAMAPYWASIVDDQIKLNDFGATDFLLTNLAGSGWTPELYYARGELYRSRGKPEDMKQAVGYYQQSVADPAAPVEAWRGLGLAQLRDGQAAAGQASLKTYLAKNPQASDRAMMAMLAGEKS